MTRKHYETIAASINSCPGDPATLLMLACDLATEFARNSARFQPARFLDACGFEDGEYEIKGGFGPLYVVPR